MLILCNSSLWDKFLCLQEMVVRSSIFSRLWVGGARYVCLWSAHFIYPLIFNKWRWKKTKWPDDIIMEWSPSYSDVLGVTGAFCLTNSPCGRNDKVHRTNSATPIYYECATWDCFKNVVLHCGAHMTVIWTDHYGFHLLLRYTFKFYHSRSPFHCTIDHHSYIIILIK